MTKKAEIIAVNNNKGGTLKTTMVINLAGVLAKLGHKVLIIDGDNQSNVVLSFGKNPDELENGLFEVLVGRSSIQDATVKVHENIDVLPATDDLIGFDFAVINKQQQYPNPFNVMKEALEGVVGLYDYILVDTPPSLGLIVGNVFNFANKVLIPFAPEKYSMRSLTKVLETIEAFKQETNPNLELLGVVPTMVKSNTVLHREIIALTENHLKSKHIKLYENYIPHSIRYASAIAYENSPVTLIENDGKGVHYELLWEEIVNDVKEKESTSVR